MSTFYIRTIFILWLTMALAGSLAAQPCTATIVSTTPAARCGAGSVLLTGSGSAGTSLIWYTAATGGSAVAYGDTFYTPVLRDTTTYYAAASAGSLAHAGAPSPTSGTNWGSTNLNGYQIFSASRALVIQSVTVYPTASGMITVALENSSGTVLQQTTLSITLPNGNYSYVPLGGGSNTTIGTGVVLPVNFSVAPGTGYRIVQYDNNSTIVRNTAGVPTSYYNTSVNGLTFTGNWIGSSGSSLSYWYNFYDWVVGTGDSSSCESARVPVQVAVRPLPAVQAGGVQNLCNGSTVTLGNGSSADSYLWSTGAITPAITVSTAGSYWLRGTSAAGCIAYDTAYVTTIAQPTVGSISATVAGSAYIFSAVNAQSTTGYFWDFGDGGTSADPSPQHIYSTAGSVTVRLCVTNACYTSCTGMAPAANTQYVTGTLNVNVTGIEEADNSILSVYPVPSSSILHIHAAGNVEMQHATITSRIGAVVYSEELAPADTMISTAHLADGVYLLRIDTGSGVLTKRFTVLH